MPLGAPTTYDYASYGILLQYNKTNKKDPQRRSYLHQRSLMSPASFKLVAAVSLMLDISST